MDRLLELTGYLLSGVLAYYLHDKRKEWSGRKAHKKAQNLQPCVDRDARVNARLAQLLFALDADKGKIFRFHNGGNYYNGQSIKKFSLTHLQLKNGIAGPSPTALKDLASSLFPNMLAKILETDKPIHWRVEDAPDAFLKSLHRAEGTNFVKVAALKDVKGQLLGFLSLNWLEEQVLEDPARKETTLKFAQEIGDLLSYSELGCKTV